MLGENQPLVVEDVLTDARFAQNPLVLGSPHIRFYAGCSAASAKWRCSGIPLRNRYKPRTLSPRQLKALQSLSRQVMTIFEARLTAVESKRTSAALMQSEKLAAVGRVASSMAHKLNNPLEAVTNLLYLSRQNAVNPDVKKWLDEAELELRRISIIANQNLRFHKQSTKLQPITCLSLFSTTLALYESRLKRRWDRR